MGPDRTEIPKAFELNNSALDNGILIKDCL